MFMLSLIFGIGVWSFLSGSNFVQYCFLYLVVEDPIIRGAGWNPIYRFNTTTFCACPKPGQEYPTQYVVFFVFYVLRADTVVRFVNIEGLVYLHCLNFLIIMLCLIYFFQTILKDNRNDTQLFTKC